jgi:hypothetical protein
MKEFFFQFDNTYKIYFVYFNQASFLINTARNLKNNIIKKKQVACVRVYNKKALCLYLVSYY